MKIKIVILLLLLVQLCAGQSKKILRYPGKPGLNTKAASLDCNNWLSIPSYPSYADVGQINITGNKITVEATINRTTPYSGGVLYAGDIVSKHDGPNDVNYLLRPNTAEITTSNGYFRTPDVCEIELNKNYHVAMVYDGSTLKFYRNGFLMSQVAATGNLYQNNWKTRIGYYENQFVNTNFIGFINEVRIWNVAKTQADIKTYMNSSLPSPTTQAGLVAYYTFDNLVNKQGNSAYNGTLGGTANINKTNTSCTFIADSCKIAVPVTSCNSWLKLSSQPAFVNIGKLDITGTQITLEATFQRTSFYSNGVLTDGDLVSKHSGPHDVNYILRPTGALIRTSNGLFITPDVCKIELNKTYHVALVYDGTKLKFYRNGFLISQIAATGNLFQNNWNTQIGLFDIQSENENFIGYINEVRIWNVARTQGQIRTYMNTSLPSPAAQTGLQAYYIFDDLVNKQGNPAWNGTLMGDAAINQTVPNCTFIADSCGKIITSCPDKEDFNYKIDICNPLSITFQSSTAFYNSIKWTLDDGTVINGITNPSHSFVNPGNHSVNMIIDKGTCSDTINKTITLNVLPVNIILTPDTTLCAGNAIQLRTQPSLGFCWSPLQYLDNPNSSNPVSSTPQNITYYYTAQVAGNNLIINGDFSQGNIGFTSEYNYANPNLTEGQYFVGANPSAWNASLGPCSGHTMGNDNMMLVNGAPVPGVNVWKQTLVVTPNTNYAFSTWVQALWPPNPAQLQFSINGKEAGTLISASLPTCTWTQFYTTWNSGNNTSAVVSIVNRNIAVQGNDFALDDISFAPVFIQKDSVVIKVENPVIKTNNDTTVCYGQAIQLNTTGPATSFNWSPITGLSNAAIANPLAKAPATTRYIITGTTVNGCIAKDTVLISVTPSPVISKTNDTTICHDKTIRLNVSGGNIYTWLPAAGLNNINIPNPVVSPVTNTTYYVTVTNTANCSSSDSIKVLVKPAPVFAVSGGASACAGIPVQLTASGGNSYIWQPADGLNNTTIANPFANPVMSTIYTVKIIENTCKDSASLTTPLTVLSLPPVQAQSSNDINCTTPTAQLSASGAFRYLWQPATGLNDSTISSPLSSPSANTLYIVKGTDLNGCSNYDTVTVKVTSTGGLIFNLPNAFSPNNDGRNDCFGISRYAGVLQQLQFSVYDRFGVRIFYTTNPLNCWDGRYKGKLQDNGGFVYVLKAKTFCGEIFKKGVVMLVR